MRVPYDSIVVHHCMAERTNVPQDESLKSDSYRSLKKHYGDRIILVDRQGTRYELDGFGQAYRGLHHFFGWFSARGSMLEPPLGHGSSLQPQSRVCARA